MTCADCGMPCKGRLCVTCRQIEINEKLHGDSVDDDDEWQVEQQGLDGEAATGQTTLDGGVVTDRGESDD